MKHKATAGRRHDLRTGEDGCRCARPILRRYDTLAGRWTARDPTLFSGHQANLYAYVSNNPVNLIDPVGFGTAGLGLCEGVCVGSKPGLEGKLVVKDCQQARW